MGFGAALPGLGKLLLVATLLFPTGADAQLTFEVIDDGLAVNSALSPNGEVVAVGVIDVSAVTAFRWEGGSSQVVTTSPSSVTAEGVDEAGDVIVGSEGQAFGFDTGAFRWESGVGLSYLAPLGIDDLMSAHDVSHDGLTIIGRSARGISESTAWVTTDFVSVTPLPDLPGGADYARAAAISGDGSVIVGKGTTASGTQAVMWTGGVATGLGDLPGGSESSEASDVSEDGSVIVGSGKTAAGSEAFRWEAGAMVGLGTLPGASVSFALGVSDNGKIISGSSGARAFVWSMKTGLVELEPYLAAHGVGVGNVTLSSARRISSDGTVIVGGGLDTDTLRPVVWRVTGLDLIPTVPAMPIGGPVAIAVLCLGVAWRAARVRGQIG